MMQVGFRLSSMPLTAMTWGLIQLTVLCGASLLVVWLLRGRRPQFASALLSGTCVAALLLTMVALIPSSQWSVVDHVPSDSNTHLLERQSFGNNVSKSESGLPASKPTNGNLAENTSNREGTELLSSTPNNGKVAITWILEHLQQFDRQLRAEESLQKTNPSVLRLPIALIFALGFSAMLTLWMHGWFYMRWIIRQSIPTNAPRLQTLVNSCSTQYGLRRIPEIRISKVVPIGATVGCLRPILVLHDGWDQWTEMELRSVLAHEMAHATRWDFLWVILGSWMRIVLFFHPLVHVVVKRLRFEQELAADQLAAGMVNDAKAYGRALASLALRSQQTTRAPSPMLAAEQESIIRRIMMIKQGSLRPRNKPLHWAGWLTLATTLVVIPLSGLRGTPPEETANAPAKTGGANDKQSESSESKITPERLAKQWELRQEAAQAFPPLRLSGPLVWRPGKFQSQDFAVPVKWYVLATCSSFFGHLPDNTEVHGRAGARVDWETIERDRGFSGMSLDIKEVNHASPELFKVLMTHPAVTSLVATEDRKIVEGREIKGLGYWRRDPVTQRYSKSRSAWMCENEDGGVYGTEEELAKYARGEYDRYAEVPAEFLDEYKRAAFANVYGDCREWEELVRKFFLGSKRDMLYQLAAPLLVGLERFGIFIEGGPENCRVRAVYRDAAAATNAKATVDGLLLMAKTWLQQFEKTETEFIYRQNARAFLETMDSMRSFQKDSEIRLVFELPSRCHRPEMYSSQPGWITPFDTSETEICENQTETYCRLPSQGIMTAFMVQSIDSVAYRGQRVRLTAELATTEPSKPVAGLMLWTSDDQQRSMSFRSQAMDGTSNIASQPLDASVPAWASEKATSNPPTYQWQKQSIEINVPANSKALTFGCYSRANEIRIRKFQLEAIGPIDDSAPSRENWVPVNFLVVPGMKLAEKPMNLDFGLSRRAISQKSSNGSSFK